MANKNVALPSKLKVIGASLDRALQEDGVILTTERINIRAEDGTCEMQIVVKGDDVGVFEIGTILTMRLTQVPD